MQVSKRVKVLYFLILAVTCNSFLIYGQSEKEQSLEDSVTYYMEATSKYKYTDFDSLMWYYNKAASFAIADENWVDYSDILSYKARFAGYYSQIDSMYNYTKLLEQSLPKLQQDTIGHLYKMETMVGYLWGHYYYTISDLSRALDRFTELNQFIVENENLKEYDYIMLIPNYVTIGNIYSTKGDQERAIQYYQYAIKTANEYREKYAPNYNHTYIYTYFANAYARKNNHVKALYYYKKVNNYYKKNIERKPSSKNSFLNNYNYIAALYLKANQPDSALLYLDESLEYHIENDPFYVKTWLNTGKAFAQKGEYIKATEYMDKALKDNQKRYGDKHSITAEIHLEKGHIFREKQDFNKALEYYQKSVISLVDKYDNNSIDNLPNHVKNVNNKKELLLALQAKVNAFYALWLENNNQDNLKYANAHTQLAINLMDNIRREYASEEARHFLMEQNYQIFEKGIDINRQLYLQTNNENYLVQAFRMAEKSKSLSLLDALKNADAQQFANIPEQTLKQERQLRTQINLINSKISKLTKEAKNENTLRQLQNELLEVQQRYDDFVDILEIDYPDYHNLKYGVEIVGVDEIRRNMLTRDAVFVEYFMGDEQLYTFFITRDNIRVFSTENTKQIQSNITELKQAITKQDNTSYVQTAHFLYQNLLEKGLEKVGKNVERIIVVPDGGLAYIPFDILLKDKIENDDTFTYRRDIMPYLINDYAISYAYSATILQQNLDKQKNNKSEYDFVGFAPNFSGLSGDGVAVRACHDNRLSNLMYAKEELEEIHKIVGGKIFDETAATKANFVNLGTKSRLIHLSTHACADEDERLSRIYFNDDEYLTALELYPLRLNADMVVLSACETGIGTLRRGEGVMSLARAFAYTGVPATTMSLWSVLDETTSKIMVNYYEHLKKSGITKDQALRLAKLDFLDKDVEKSQHQHPYYWAAFVHIGNAEPLTQGTNWWLWASLFVLVLGIVVVRQLRSI